MKKFDNYKTYLAALTKQPNLAIMPISAAASVMKRGSLTIKNWIRDGKIDGITIDGDQYVQASALQAKVSDYDDEVLAVKERLIEILNEGRRYVYYSEIMDEFGYSSTISPDRSRFGYILGEVSCRSHEEMENDLGGGNGGLLSSIVWRKDSDYVGAGYWDLVERLGYEASDDLVEDHIDLCIAYYVK